MNEELKVGDEVVYLPIVHINKTKVKSVDTIGGKPYYFLQDGNQGGSYRVKKVNDPELIAELKRDAEELQYIIKKLERGEF